MLQSKHRPKLHVNTVWNQESLSRKRRTKLVCLKFHEIFSRHFEHFLVRAQVRHISGVDFRCEIVSKNWTCSWCFCIVGARNVEMKWAMRKENKRFYNWKQANSIWGISDTVYSIGMHEIRMYGRVLFTWSVSFKEKIISPVIPTPFISCPVEKLLIFNPHTYSSPILFRFVLLKQTHSQSEQRYIFSAKCAVFFGLNAENRKQRGGCAGGLGVHHRGKRVLQRAKQVFNSFGKVQETFSSLTKTPLLFPRCVCSTSSCTIRLTSLDGRFEIGLDQKALWCDRMLLFDFCTSSGPLERFGSLIEEKFFLQRKRRRKAQNRRGGGVNQ